MKTVADQIARDDRNCRCQAHLRHRWRQPQGAHSARLHRALERFYLVPRFQYQPHQLEFAAMAEAAGIRGIRLEEPADVDKGMAVAFAYDGQVLRDAVVNRAELAMPPSITIEMAKGFSLCMVEAITDGRTDDGIDLATTTLWC